jgi:hypothetical protein
VTAKSAAENGEVVETFPKQGSVESEVPERAGAFLQQAMDSLHSPVGAVLLCASAVDAMLKNKGYTEGNLFTRIDKAATEHLITADMAKWAHSVRLDANDQRHADSAADLPSASDAKRSLDFASTLAQILFVLPARVKRGLQPPKESGKKAG